MPLPVGRESSLALLNSLEGTEKILGVVAQLDPRVEAPTGTDLHGVGTLAKVHKMVRMPNGNVVAFLEGLDRIRVKEVLGFKPFLKAAVELQPDLETQRDSELTALERNVQELFREVVARSPQLSDDLQTEVMSIDAPGKMADFVASTLPSLSTMIRQELLETFSVRKRFESLISELTKEREVLDLRNKIQDQVQEQVNQSQREFLLREQMKAIQKELGESDDGVAEIDELRKKVEESGMSAEAKKECDRELKRLAKMTPASAEYMVARTYLEWMTSLPWNKTSGTDDIDIPKAQEILDEDHYDLVKIKQRILDYLAVKKLQPGMKGPILCFVGPPGVGKTSLGKSIARSLGRKFVRLDYNGESTPPFVSDELTIDFEKRAVLLEGNPVRLTPKEFELLRQLVANQGKAQAHRRLLQAVWGPDYGDETEYLRVFINQLRKKIEPDPRHPRYIHTEPWVGYRFEPPAAKSKHPRSQK